MSMIGAGFNPSDLPLPSSVSLIELGLEEFKRLKSSPSSFSELESRAISIHLARSPITEDTPSQEAFLVHLRSELKSHAVRSIGFHLTGPRDCGIGKYGFSSHYDPSPELEARAIRFLLRAREMLDTEIWLENANLYSPSARSAAHSWESFTRIIRSSGAGIILDLSHLIIDSSNLGLSPAVFLGKIPLEMVSEVHLSGMIRGHDGAFHDGHSQSVSEECWELLATALRLGVGAESKTCFTIEHTDPDWSATPDLYVQDFDRLTSLLKQKDSAPETSRSQLSEAYARAYLLKLLIRRIPKLEQACLQRGRSPKDLFNAWLDQVSRNSCRISLTDEELSPKDRSRTVIATQDFINFVKKELTPC